MTWLEDGAVGGEAVGGEAEKTSEGVHETFFPVLLARCRLL